jgi:hypothetical protein
LDRGKAGKTSKISFQGSVFRPQNIFIFNIKSRNENFGERVERYAKQQNEEKEL